MQLKRGDGAVRARIGSAACMLLATALPARAHAQSASGATTRLDATTLLYAERSRTRVIEPMVKFSRLMPNGQVLSAQVGIDVMTGATPTGAMPSTTVQTTTGASGHVMTHPAGELPTSTYGDLRAVVDLEWQQPLMGRLAANTGGHVSLEGDYRSVGVNEKLSLEMFQRLVTVSAGVGYNSDGVKPKGGTPPPLSDGSQIVTTGYNAKHVTTGLLGISRILTRRWMVALNGSRTFERGYLTEPYKVVSVISPATGEATRQLTERRPDARNRTDVLASSVYHLHRDVLYLSYRRYWDDWGIKSNTFDLKYRLETGGDRFYQPHLRFYSQTAADFFVYSLVGEPTPSALPAYATSDYRLGPLRTLTAGMTFGFRMGSSPGEWTIRPEYIRQWGNGHPASAIGVQRQVNLFPAVDIGSVVIGYSLEF